MDYEVRIMKTIVLPVRESIFSEQATSIEIIDEGGGEFLKVSQQNGCGKGEIVLEPNDWPDVREEINRMMSFCRKDAQ